MKDPYDVRAAMEEEMDIGGLTFTEPTEFSKLRREERILQELDFMPVSEIMAGDDLELKRGAIERLAEIKSEEAIALLTSYRTDPDMDTRFFVTTALSRIKKDFEEQLQAAKEEMKKDVYNIAIRIFLAKSYLQYARSELLDDTTVRVYEGEALYHLQFSIMDEDAPEEVFWLLIDIYQARREWEKVIQVLDVIENRNLGDIENRTIMRIQALYNLERYPGVTEVLEKSVSQKPVGSRVQTLANWWGVTV